MDVDPGNGQGLSPGVDETWLVVNKSKNGALVETDELSESARNGRGATSREELQRGGNQDDRDVEERPSETLQTERPYEAATQPAVVEYEVGRRVTLETYGHGVVRWVGEVGGERTAGIELDDYTSGCGDGRLPGAQQPLFSCDDGHGVFVPMFHMTSDPRFTEEVDVVSVGAERPRQLFEQGSMVEVKGYGYGVVQWLGNLSGRETAGVELEEYRELCGNGTPEGGEKVLFPCQPGHGVFSPVTELIPDSRFTSLEATNPLNDVPLETVPGRVPIPQPAHYCRGRQWGIQGEYNSCYLDATLFGLFALSSEFDTLLSPEQRGPQGGTQGEISTEICTTLHTQIINPLRKNGVLRSEPILQLRGQLDQLGKMAGLTQEEKDPEEFLNTLFKHALSTRPFISIQRPQGEEEEFFVQLFMEPDPSLKTPSIHDLLSRMFAEQEIKFSTVPQKLLIQVPRYGKQFKTFQRIIPSKRLDIASLCTSTCLTVDYGQLNAHLQLLSVICIETSHYVCFTWSQDRWVFMDSMADRIDNRFNIPSCIDCIADLEEWVYGARRHKLPKQPTRKPPDLVRRFTQDIYMCVYVEDCTAV